MYLPIILAMVLYPLLAIVFVIFVWKRTSRKLLRWLAVAFAILLPSWDAVLSAVVYYSGCPFFSKAQIYETAETQGIYYEGDHFNTLLIIDRRDGERVMSIPQADRDINNGYRYAEYLVTKKKEGAYGTESPVSPPVVYQCIALPRDPKWPWNIPYQCIPIKITNSKYVVKSRRMEILLVTINSMEIYDNSNKRLMAEYRGISKHPYAGLPYFPFFTWLNWDHGEFRADTTEPVSCPQKSQFYTFQYQVLKLKK